LLATNTRFKHWMVTQQHSSCTTRTDTFCGYCGSKHSNGEGRCDCWRGWETLGIPKI